MNMTEALAKSNNLYFEELGRELGFERVRHYANQFGLGELAGYNIEGEQLGVYPDKELPASEGGVGRMCSFGQGVSLTPLQLGAFVAAIANGGTLYYLQHPTTPEEAAKLEPKVKRTLDIARYVPDMEDGISLFFFFFFLSFFLFFFFLFFFFCFLFTQPRGSCRIRRSTQRRGGRRWAVRLRGRRQ